MRFYFDGYTAITEPELVTILVFDGCCEDEEEALYMLHACGEVAGWYEIEASDDIKKALDKIEKV